MVPQSKTFNIYCDESCHLQHDGNRFMLIGSVSCAYTQVRLHSGAIREIMKKHSFKRELKWTSVSKSKIGFYLELADYFFATDLKFKTIVADKLPHVNDDWKKFDDFYYKTYYQLLTNNVNTMYHYNVYPDIKDTLSAMKVARLKEILNVKYGVFRNVQNIRSEESVLLQLADFIMGSFAYTFNNHEKKSETKSHVAQYIYKKSGLPDEIRDNPKLPSPLFIDIK